MTTYVYKGYGITNENGVAKLEYDENGDPLTHSYTGTGAGEIDLVGSLDNPIDEGSLVSETFSIDDTYNYDDGTLNSHHDIWTDVNNALTRYEEYSELAETQGTDVAMYTSIPSNCIIEYDVSIDTGTYSWIMEITASNTTWGTGFSLANCYTSAQPNTFYHIKIECNSTNFTVHLYDMQGRELGSHKKENLTHSIQRAVFRTRDNPTKIRFKNFRIYNA